MANRDKKANEKRKIASIFGKLSAFWTTRQMADSVNSGVEAQITLRELIVYAMFLILLLVLSFGMTSSTMFWYTKVMKNLFAEVEFTQDEEEGFSFKTSTSMNHFWDFTETALINGLYWNSWYNRTAPLKHELEGNETYKWPTPTNKDDQKIMYHNKLLGLPRLRQLRVRPASCIVHKRFRKLIKKCYDFYSRQKEDKSPFGKKSGTAWTYQTEEELKGTSYYGVVSTYRGGGFVQDLDVEMNKTIEIIRGLKEGLWLDRGTRAVFLDFTVYNANINLFCIVKMVMEFPPTGGVIPTYTFRTVKLLRYVRPFDFFVLACELLFVVFTVYYTLEELHEMAHFKWLYFTNWWNNLDVVIITVSYLCTIFNIYRYAAVTERLHKLLENDQHYEDFSSLGFWQMQYNNVVAICVFFSWIKIFKYISFNQTMSQLSNTLSRCARDVAGFAIMFFIVFCAFAQLGYLLFGTQVEAFSSNNQSVFTLLRTILGDFDYDSIENANRFLGPIFFIMYIFFVFFVLLNMFLAIINDTYSEVKSEIAIKRNEFEVAEFIARGVNNVKSMIGMKTMTAPTVTKDGINYDDIKALLRKCNFTELEIEMFFAKYDVDNDRLVSSEEITRMMRDLAEDDGSRRSAKSFVERNKSSITPKEYKSTEQRIQKLEGLVRQIAEQCTNIADTLENRPEVKPLVKIEHVVVLEPKKEE